MPLPPRKPMLALNAYRDLALRELPDDADVQVFLPTNKDRQQVPLLRPGTAAKGAIEFGCQISNRRLYHGACLVTLAALKGGARIVRELLDPAKAELLVLETDIAPLSSFDLPS